MTARVPKCRRNQYQRWSKADNMRLMVEWGEVSARTMVKTFGRTESAIYYHAVRHLKLPPQRKRLVSLSTFAVELETTAWGLRSVLAQVGNPPTRSSFLADKRRVGSRCVLVDPTVATEALSQHDHRTITANAYDRSNRLLRHATNDRMIRLGFREPPSGRRREWRYPFGLLDEVRGGEDGPWTATWRAVLAQTNLPAERWFVALAAHDIVFDSDNAYWVDIVATQKVMEAIDRVGARIKASAWPTVVRATVAPERKRDAA